MLDLLLVCKESLKKPKVLSESVYRRRTDKEKVQKEKQRSTKHTHKTKDRVTRTQLKAGVNSGVPEGLAVPVPLLAPFVLI